MAQDPEVAEGPARLRYVVQLEPRDEALARLYEALGLGRPPAEGDYDLVEIDPGRLRLLAQSKETEALLYLPEATGEDRPEGRRHRLSSDVPLVPTGFARRRNAAPGPAVHGRHRAEALIGADALRAFAAEGDGVVNVVLVDTGIDEDYVRTIVPGLDVRRLPGVSVPDHAARPRRRRTHGDVVARSILALAPEVRLWDVPVLPESLDDVAGTTLPVIVALDRVLERVACAPDEAWVVVCAWGIRSRAFETGALTYSDDRGHILSQRLVGLVGAGADVVFSAGNNGLFWPDPRAGHADRGPALSVMGAPGLPETLCVGAVTALGDWIGESSQGPEPEGLRLAGPARKPDLCAPSWFTESDDRHALSTGTSTACAMAAGVVAAVRRRVPPSTLPPAALVARLRQTARPLGFEGGEARDDPASWRLGSGVLDAEALVGSL